ncbi:MAG TPA: SH3 domain-containing protein [Acetobacteraceae bacterium]|jgi:SH3-like domain-containing protein|nr:SH3 domain-containing protein [Acetobacteraceae bacterium]
MARSVLRCVLVLLLLWRVPAAALELTHVPAPERRVAVIRIADARPTPVVRPHGALHPARPRYRSEPQLPLPLPPPLPEQAVQPPSPAATAPKTAPAKPAEAEKPTGLPLPRFAALRTDDVNMRAGPGFRYPIMWVYKRRGLPMEIEREFEIWRLVEDPDGTKGWVHEATLTGRRTFLVQGADATLRAKPDDDARAVAILKVGVIGRIRSCDAGSVWCRVEVRDYSGYVKRSQFWGTLPGEVIAP